MILKCYIYILIQSRYVTRKIEATTRFTGKSATSASKMSSYTYHDCLKRFGREHYKTVNAYYDYIFSSVEEARDLYTAMLEEYGPDHEKIIAQKGIMETLERMLEVVKITQPVASRLRKRNIPALETIHAKKLRKNSEFSRGENLAFYKTSERNASSSSRIREKLIQAQEGMCPGLITMDGFIHRKCSKSILYGGECDHIIELRHRGIDCEDNCQMLCHECHAEKTRANYHRQTVT